jgi:hypothetical protein
VLLAETLPELARELEQLLAKAGESKLAAHVSQLAIVERCRCDDDFCSSFDTQPKPKGRYGADHGSIDLDAAQGILILDVVGGKIAQVEVLNRDDIRTKLIADLP